MKFTKNNSINIIITMSIVSIIAIHCLKRISFHSTLLDYMHTLHSIHVNLFRLFIIITDEQNELTHSLFSLFTPKIHGANSLSKSICIWMYNHNLLMATHAVMMMMRMMRMVDGGYGWIPVEMRWMENFSFFSYFFLLFLSN